MYLLTTIAIRSKTTLDKLLDMPKWQIIHMKKYFDIEDLQIENYRNKEDKKETKNTPPEGMIAVNQIGESPINHKNQTQSDLEALNPSSDEENRYLKND